MNNKVLVKILLPSMEKEFDVFIPVNEQMWKVEKLLMKCIYSVENVNYDPRTENFCIINKKTGQMYEKNVVIIDTDIRNGTELYFVREEMPTEPAKQ